MENESERPDKDERQKRIDHGLMLKSHRARIERRRHEHSRRRHLNSVIPITLV